MDSLNFSDMSSATYLENDLIFSGPLESQYVMSESAYLKLVNNLARTKATLKEAGEYAGEAGANNDWHDNPALDDAKNEIYLSNAILSMQQEALDNAMIAIPNQDAQKVGIGSLVALRFGDDDMAEQFHILGEIDVLFEGKGVLSWKSPIGRKILGKTSGSVVDIEVGGNKFQVQITEILPGMF